MAYSNPLLKVLLYEESPEAADLLVHGDAFIVIVPPLEPKDELMVDTDFLCTYCTMLNSNVLALRFSRA